MRVDALGAAIFAALAAHSRRRPLRLFNDGATALRCVAAARSDGAPPADLPLAPPGPALAHASAALLASRGAVTTLAKVAAHANVEGNRVADALAEIGAERRDDVLDVPAAFDGAGAGRGASRPALQLRYLPTRVHGRNGRGIARRVPRQLPQRDRLTH